jgi:hypothetical protein
MNCAAMRRCIERTAPEQAARLMLDDVARQLQVHALPGLERRLGAVVTQQQHHRRAQRYQQRHGKQRRARVQPLRPGRAGAAACAALRVAVRVAVRVALRVTPRLAPHAATSKR